MTEDEIYYAYLKENPEFLALNPMDPENRKAITSDLGYLFFAIKENFKQMLRDTGLMKTKPEQPTKAEGVALLRAALESFGHDTSHLTDEELEANAMLVSDNLRVIGLSTEEAVENIKAFNSMGYEVIPQEVRLTEQELNKIEQPWKTKRKKKPWE